ncbi:hypothetical protein PHSC3_000502 [Chlamydiales bacterium STE3]|nr:hypothetical protein PHSC3_000502 [Chlamydiales bacterium STE3]
MSQFPGNMPGFSVHVHVQPALVAPPLFQNNGNISKAVDELWNAKGPRLSLRQENHCYMHAHPQLFSQFSSEDGNSLIQCLNHNLDLLDQLNPNTRLALMLEKALEKDFELFLSFPNDYPNHASNAHIVNRCQQKLSSLVQLVEHRSSSINGSPPVPSYIPDPQAPTLLREQISPYLPEQHVTPPSPIYIPASPEEAGLQPTSTERKSLKRQLARLREAISKTDSLTIEKMREKQVKKQEAEKASLAKKKAEQSRKRPKPNDSPVMHPKAVQNDDGIYETFFSASHPSPAGCIVEIPGKGLLVTHQHGTYRNGYSSKDLPAVKKVAESIRRCILYLDQRKAAFPEEEKSIEKIIEEDRKKLKIFEIRISKLTSLINQKKPPILEEKTFVEKLVEKEEEKLETSESEISKPSSPINQQELSILEKETFVEKMGEEDEEEFETSESEISRPPSPRKSSIGFLLN